MRRAVASRIPAESNVIESNLPRPSFLSLPSIPSPFSFLLLHAPSLLVDAREPASDGEQLRADNADEQKHLEYGQPLRTRVGALGGCERRTIHSMERNRNMRDMERL